MQASKWVPHNGGPCPVPTTEQVFVQLRRDPEHTRKYLSRVGPAGQYDWKHEDSESDIMFYALVEKGIAPPPVGFDSVDRPIEYLTQVTADLSSLIGSTPSGERRNMITEANIGVMLALDRLNGLKRT